MCSECFAHPAAHRCVVIRFHPVIIYCEYFGHFDILVQLNFQWLAKKLAVSISVIRKLAVVFIPVEIQKFY